MTAAASVAGAAEASCSTASALIPPRLRCLIADSDGLFGRHFAIPDPRFRDELRELPCYDELTDSLEAAFAEAYDVDVPETPLYPDDPGDTSTYTDYDRAFVPGTDISIRTHAANVFFFLALQIVPRLRFDMPSDAETLVGWCAQAHRCAHRCRHANSMVGVFRDADARPNASDFEERADSARFLRSLHTSDKLVRAFEALNYEVGVDEEDVVFNDKHAALRGPPTLVLSPFRDAADHVAQDVDVLPWSE